MMPAAASPPPLFDAAAKERAKRVAVAAGKRKTRDEGLKAIHAVLHRRCFKDERAAWEAYGSSRQRFYEWKPHCPATLDTLLHVPANAETPAPQPWRYSDLPQCMHQTRTIGCLPDVLIV